MPGKSPLGAWSPPTAGPTVRASDGFGEELEAPTIEGIFINLPNFLQYRLVPSAGY